MGDEKRWEKDVRRGREVRTHLNEPFISQTALCSCLSRRLRFVAALLDTGPIYVSSLILYCPANISL